MPERTTTQKQDAVSYFPFQGRLLLPVNETNGESHKAFHGGRQLIAISTSVRRRGFNR
jgi:hypothetical protein